MKQSGHAMKRNTVIFDLDGTLANIEKRRLIAGSPTGNKPEKSKMDWDVFFDPRNIQLDEPNLPVIKMAQYLQKMDLESLSSQVEMIGRSSLLSLGYLAIEFHLIC